VKTLTAEQEYQRQYRKKHRERILKQQRKWRENNREKIAQYQADYWAKKAKELVANDNGSTDRTDENADR